MTDKHFFFDENNSYILTTPERSLRPFARPKSSFGGGSATRVRKVSLLDPFMPPLTKGSTAFLSMQKKNAQGGNQVTELKIRLQ